MWCYVHITLCTRCTCGDVYKLYRWCHVHVFLCTRYAGGDVYRWYCVHVVHVVLVYMRYYVCAWCIHGIMTCVFPVLYFMQYMYVVVLYTRCTCVSTCIVWRCTSGIGACALCQVQVLVLHGIVCRVWLYVCDTHYVYVHLVNENTLGVCQVWKLIHCAYEIRIKAEVRINKRISIVILFQLYYTCGL